MSEPNVDLELTALREAVTRGLCGPLRAISSSCHLLREELVSRIGDSTEAHIATIESSVHRIARLLAGLSHLARAVHAPLRPERCDVRPWTEATLRVLRAEEPYRLVEETIDVSYPVWGDPELVELLVDQLVRNAWTFTSRKAASRIAVSTRPHHGFAVLSATDDGEGFDPDFAERMFRPFERLHSSSEFPGAGLGLAVVAEIARRHGGRCAAVGEPGRGATFEVWLPTPVN